MRTDLARNELNAAPGAWKNRDLSAADNRKRRVDRPF
jgi:hypothetical protein